MKKHGIEQLIGKTLERVDVLYTFDHIVFVCNDGVKYKMFHSQDCCESVVIDDIVGDLKDLIGSPILIAEELKNHDEHPEGVEKREPQDDSFTWTFYKLATAKGYVDIRWYGTSNGYYSESVSFEEGEIW